MYNYVVHATTWIMFVHKLKALSTISTSVFSAVIFLNKIIPNTFFSILDIVQNFFGRGTWPLRKSKSCTHGSRCRLSRRFIWVFIHGQKPVYLVTTFWKERHLNQGLLHMLYVRCNFPQGCLWGGFSGSAAKQGNDPLYIGYTPFIEKSTENKPSLLLHTSRNTSASSAELRVNKASPESPIILFFFSPALPTTSPHFAAQQIRLDKTWNCCFDCGAPRFHGPGNKAHSPLANSLCFSAALSICLLT